MYADVMIRDDDEINLVGVCAIAPIVGVFAATILFVAAASLNLGAAPAISGPAAMLDGFRVSLPALFVVPVLGWIVALPGMFALGYPVLRFFQRLRLRSIVLHAMSGALLGGFYLAALSTVIEFADDWSDIYTAFCAGCIFGLLTGLSARWAMTWAWLRN